jgi:hypothetical protein
VTGEAAELKKRTVAGKRTRDERENRRLGGSVEFPADLPEILCYRLGTYHGQEVILKQLPRTPVHYVGTSGCTNAAQVCPRIPHGATGWKHAGEEGWRELCTLPRHWFPFINRERGTEMDPRPGLKRT